MHGAELGLQLVAIASSEVGLEILHSDERQEGVTEVRGVVLVVERHVGALAGEGFTQGGERPVSHGTV